MNDTISEYGHGGEFGTSHLGKDPNSFEVVKVIRIQDPIQWSSYCVRREELRDLSLKFGFHPHIKSNPLITPCLDDAVNEYYLFHGTSDETIKIILDMGFDERYAEVNGMFGPGIYFAENSSKSNQYVACPKCDGGSIPRKGQKCSCDASEIIYSMILSRVCLGNPYVCNDYKFWSLTKDDRQKNRSENYSPIPQEGCTACTHPIIREHHSVYAEKNQDGLRLFNREFVVYDKRQTYPEFIIYYKRKFI